MYDRVVRDAPSEPEGARMKAAKAEQIRRVRLAAKQLRTMAHVEQCRCCQYDADTIETFADAPYAPTWLAHVAKRVSEMGSAPSGTTPPAT